MVLRQPVQVVEAEPERVGGAEAALIFGTRAVELDGWVMSLLQDRPAAAVRLGVAPQSQWGRREHLLLGRVKAPTPVDVVAVNRTAGRLVAGVDHLAAPALVVGRTAAVERPVGGADTRPAVRTRLIAGDPAEPRRPEHDPRETDVRYADPVHALPLKVAIQHRVQV